MLLDASVLITDKGNHDDSNISCALFIYLLLRIFFANANIFRLFSVKVLSRMLVQIWKIVGLNLGQHIMEMPPQIDCTITHAPVLEFQIICVLNI